MSKLTATTGCQTDFQISSSVIYKAYFLTALEQDVQHEVNFTGQPINIFVNGQKDWKIGEGT